jgi:hypothetical protein
MQAETQNISSSLQQQLKEAVSDTKNKLLANDARVKGILKEANKSFDTPDQKIAIFGECKGTDGNKRRLP